MSTVIYYFTGRGNSFRTANDLSGRLDNAEIRFMGREANYTVDKTVDCIGIITLVIDFGIPAFVKKFVKKFKVEGNQPYVFSIITCGGMPCASLSQLKRCLIGNGIKLSAGFTVQFGLKQYDDLEWNKLLDDMSLIIRSRTVVPTAKSSLKDTLFTGLLNPMARLMIPNEDKKFHVSDACNGCGVCNRVCPVNNINMEEKRPVWLHKCEQCAACFAWCPKDAISGTNLAAKTRYTNPHVALKQILSE